MSRRLSKSYFIVSVAVMSALAIIFDLLPSVRVPWGMKIDFVGTIWVLSYFLYGPSVALSVSMITTLYIIMFSVTSFVGAIMKFIATIPMFLALEGLLRLPFFSKRTSTAFNKLPTILAGAALAILVRIVSCCFANYYWAVPLFVGPDFMTNLFGDSIFAFIVYVIGMNLLQGIVDITASWFLAFKARIVNHFGTW
jgi:riboflavin transporter FmnP